MATPYNALAGSHVQAAGLSDQDLLDAARSTFRDNPIVRALVDRYEGLQLDASRYEDALDKIHDRAYDTLAGSPTYDEATAALIDIIGLIPEGI